MYDVKLVRSHPRKTSAAPSFFPNDIVSDDDLVEEEEAKVIDKDEARMRGQDILSRLITPSLPRDTSNKCMVSNDEDDIRSKSMESFSYLEKSDISSSSYGISENSSFEGNSSVGSPYKERDMLRRGSINDAMDAIHMVQQAMEQPSIMNDDVSSSHTSSYVNDNVSQNDDKKWEQMDRELV